MLGGCSFGYRHSQRRAKNRCNRQLWVTSCCTLLPAMTIVFCMERDGILRQPVFHEQLAEGD